MLAALQLIEGFRAKGEPLTGRVFLVCRDAAMECGAWLKVTNSRTVNVRKGNRPPRIVPMRMETHPFLRDDEIIITNDAPPLERVGAADVTFDNRRWHEVASEQDRADAASLAAQINAMPALTATRTQPRMLGLLEHVASNIIPRADLRQRYPEWRTEGASYHIPLDPDFFRPENGFGYFGREWDSDRIFREIDGADVAEARVRGLQARRVSYRITGIDFSSSSITVAPEVGRPLAQPVVLDKNAPPAKSRVPAHVHRNRPRLDGRRFR